MVNNGAAELFNTNGSLRFDNPKTVEAYAFHKDMFKYSAPDATNWTWGEAEACFDANKCGTVLQFTVISTYKAPGGDPADLGVGPVPRANGEAAPNTISYSNAAMILAKDPAKRQAAEKFIGFLLEPANYGRFLNMEPGLFLPVTEDGAKAPSFWNDPLAVKYKTQIETMIANSRRGMLFGFTTDKVFPSIGAISAENVLAETLQRVVVDGETPTAAVAAGHHSDTIAGCATTSRSSLRVRSLTAARIFKCRLRTAADYAALGDHGNTRANPPLPRRRAVQSRRRDGGGCPKGESTGSRAVRPWRRGRVRRTTPIFASANVVEQLRAAAGPLRRGATAPSATGPLLDLGASAARVERQFERGHEARRMWRVG
jgi:hypothetical protein